MLKKSLLNWDDEVPGCFRAGLMTEHLSSFLKDGVR